jgi:hypothetical protein
MSMLFQIGTRRWITFGGGLALATLFLVGVPLPYQRTVGHEVTLSLTGASLDRLQLQHVADQMRSLLHSRGVRVSMVEESAGDPRFELTTDVPRESRLDVATVAQALEAALQAKGFDAETRVEARKERISGTLLAMAQERIIEISVDGKSAAELEAEISRALTDAGLDYAEVSVEEEADGGKRVTIEAKAESDQPGSGEVLEPTIVLTSNGEPLSEQSDAKRTTCRVMKRMEDSGAVLAIEVTTDSRETTVEIPNPETYSDSDLASEIESRLFAEGISADVTVEDGRVELSVRD